MLRSVFTTALPPLGTTARSAADRSNPAEWGEPRDGIVARSLRNFTRRHSSCPPASGGVVAAVADIVVAAVEIVVATAGGGRMETQLRGRSRRREDAVVVVRMNAEGKGWSSSRRRSGERMVGPIVQAREGAEARSERL